MSRQYSTSNTNARQDSSSNNSQCTNGPYTVGWSGTNYLLFRSNGDGSDNYFIRKKTRVLSWLYFVNPNMVTQPHCAYNAFVFEVCVYYV